MKAIVENQLVALEIRLVACGFQVERGSNPQNTWFCLWVNGVQICPGDNEFVVNRFRGAINRKDCERKQDMVDLFDFYKVVYLINKLF